MLKKKIPAATTVYIPMLDPTSGDDDWSYHVARNKVCTMQILDQSQLCGLTKENGILILLEQTYHSVHNVDLPSTLPLGGTTFVQSKPIQSLNEWDISIIDYIN